MPATIDEPLARAKGEFQRRFGRSPRFAAAAPGRVNLIGEHTDYTGGFVLPIAIDRVCVAVGGLAADQSTSRIATADLGRFQEIDWRSGVEVGALPGPRRVPRGSWPSYIAGVAAEFRETSASRGRPLPNLDIAVASSVPVGSGLSSSAAIEVATATLLEAITGLSLDPRDKALLCQGAEHRYAGVPCGIMDQFISVMGQRDHALLIDCRSQEAQLVAVPPSSKAAIVVMDTGVRHALASGQYAQRRAACQAAESRLGTLLRDATLEAVMRTFPADDPLLPIARHVVSENDRTRRAAAALRAGDLPLVGRLMSESHASLRDDYRVSCPELDTLVDAAASNPGTFGARMTGGGFGGCAIALCAPQTVSALSARLEQRYAATHRHRCATFTALPSDGARQLQP